MLARLADAIRAKPRDAQAMGKSLFYRQIEGGLAAAYDDAAAVMACNYMQPDAREGITAFLEKRPPVW